MNICPSHTKSGQYTIQYILTNDFRKYYDTESIFNFNKLRQGKKKKKNPSVQNIYLIHDLRSINKQLFIFNYNFITKGRERKNPTQNGRFSTNIFH